VNATLQLTETTHDIDRKREVAKQFPFGDDASPCIRCGAARPKSNRFHASLVRTHSIYIRLREEFVFLAVILDAFSRRVIGWALDRSMEDELTLTALRMALSRRSLQPGLVHDTDRGGQHASNEYTELLQAHGIQISMSRKAIHGTTRPATHS
jgi:transposase InsO family protein